MEDVRNSLLYRCKAMKEVNKLLANLDKNSDQEEQRTAHHLRPRCYRMLRSLWLQGLGPKSPNMKVIAKFGRSQANERNFQ